MLFNYTAAGIAYAFDERNLVSSAGLAPLLRLAQNAGLKRLADQWLTVFNTGADKGANPEAKIMSLVSGLAAGADSINNRDILRHGGMKSLFRGVGALNAGLTSV
ncbi:hypothetical protein GCM10009720_09970 [Yaniella flava]|uniref:Uncharacterized protein n=1 Tax=Yaniella flava TaxID=287930 RepID=A0ABP5FUE6_9MICC